MTARGPEHLPMVMPTPNSKTPRPEPPVSPIGLDEVLTEFRRAVKLLTRTMKKANKCDWKR